MAVSKVISLIMAGGSGTRFWPASRKKKPKQFLKLWSDRSLIQETADRIGSLSDAQSTYVVATRDQVGLLSEHLDTKNFILEPCGRNTAPCLMLSAARLLKDGWDEKTPIIVLPADHYIKDSKAFISILEKAIDFARQGERIVTLGIVPTSPHTGYGYIEAGQETDSKDIYRAKRFLEKPNAAKAKQFVDSKSFYWNGGIFIWTLSTLCKAFERHLTQDWAAIRNSSSDTELNEIYQKINASPIDTALMEKADNVYVIPAAMGWSDIGSWNALYELRKDPKSSNAIIQGTVDCEASQRCLVDVPNKKVALVGVSDLIIVDTGDTLMVCHRDQDQLVKNVAQRDEPNS